jgi:hypothetical protein
LGKAISAKFLRPSPTAKPQAVVDLLPMFVDSSASVMSSPLPPHLDGDESYKGDSCGSFEYVARPRTLIPKARPNIVTNANQRKTSLERLKLASPLALVPEKPPSEGRYEDEQLKYMLFIKAFTFFH